MSEVKVNKITPTADCGTVTLGDSGDTLSIPSGATLDVQGTVSGLEGVVSWDTTAKTAAFTAEANRGYFVDTTSAAITVTLPASPTAGDLVAVKDYAFTADTNNITLARNGSNIQGVANDFLITTEGRSVTLIYVDATQGWLLTGASQKSDISNPQFTIATGGTVTTCGDYKIHTFTGPGTFSVTQIGNSPTVPVGGPQVVEYLVQAGGGGGGGNQGGPSYAAGGGGAGGFRASNGTTAGCYTAGPTPITSPVSGITASVQDYPITVGAGGAGRASGGEQQGQDGSNSVFSTITSTGGGGGGSGVGPHNTGPRAGRSGGSGGGGGQASGSPGSGNSPPVSPPQGNSGGTAGGGSAPSGAGAGGGGIGGSGTNGSVGCSVRGGPGGSGASPNITGTTIYVAQGGGGGAGTNGCTGIGGGSPSNRTAGNGGRASPGPFPGSAGTANRGGGGGGSGGDGSNGGNAGSGIVVIRYKYQ